MLIMAMLPISSAIGTFHQPSNGHVESLKRFSPTCHFLCRRLLSNYEDIINRKKELINRGTVTKNRYSFRKVDCKAQALSSISIDQAEQSLAKYLFRTENGGQVKVAVGKKSSKYSVSIEVLPLEMNFVPQKLILSWGVYRSDSSSFIPLELQSAAADGNKAIYETPVTRNSFGTYTVEMEFESYLAPLYLSFVLKYPFGDDGESLEIKTHRHTNYRVPVGIGSGYPAPLGLSVSSDGRLNFALLTRSAESVFLCLYDDNNSGKPTLELELDSYVNQTGDIWHVSLDNCGSYVRYGYRCKGTKLNGIRSKVLLDPYARLIGKVPGSPDLGELCKIADFDWGRDIFPRLSMEKLVVYRLNVRHFTGSKSSKLPVETAGTFIGVIESLQHFTKLGINAILLEPVFPYSKKMGPYFPSHFFSLQQAYGPEGDSISAINSMKEMVKRMHAIGIEVFMEVVFTQTADNGALREIDHPSYFYAYGDQDLVARNALNCNYPIVQKLIVDSLRYWVTEFHIDGFCFINASYLMKGFHGETLTHPPLVETIAFDPILSKIKLIADCWDSYDSTSKEITFPHWKRWAELNRRFPTDVRNFLRGEGLISSLATRLCGSGDIFAIGRGPAFSFNYIARNFGLPLVDLVSFSKAEELSWNCGEEGPTNKKVVLERRIKQIRNLLFTLFVSLGVPVLNMGDECGQSSGGSLDYNARKPLNWAALKTPFGIQITQFISYLTSLRERRSDLLQKREFLKEENIDWYDSDLSQPKWDDPLAKFLAMLLKAENGDIQLSSEPCLMKGDLYVAFNAGENSVSVILPSPPEEMKWVVLVDTALSFPGFFSSDGIHIPEQMPGLASYEMKPYSSVLFEAKFKGSSTV